MAACMSKPQSAPIIALKAGAGCPVNVRRCGLVLDTEHCDLGASPDVTSAALPYLQNAGRPVAASAVPDEPCPSVLPLACTEKQSQNSSCPVDASTVPDEPSTSALPVASTERTSLCGTG